MSSLNPPPPPPHPLRSPVGEMTDVCEHNGCQRRRCKLALVSRGHMWSKVLLRRGGVCVNVLMLLSSPARAFHLPLNDFAE